MTQPQIDLPTVRFARDTTGFAKTLRQRVEAYFKENGIHKKANGAMVFKTILLVSLYLGPVWIHRRRHHRRRVDVLGC